VTLSLHAFLVHDRAKRTGRPHKPNNAVIPSNGVSNGGFSNHETRVLTSASVIINRRLTTPHDVEQLSIQKQ
jgi:hypothetical protein